MAQLLNVTDSLFSDFSHQVLFLSVFLPNFQESHNRSFSTAAGIQTVVTQVLQLFQLQLLSSILGGGMSSRLFQQVREQKGLCYSIYSYGTCHDNTGYFGVYTALGRETEGQALDTILAVIREPTEHGVTQAELDRAREQSKANVLMGLESAQSHMSSLGRGEVLDEDAIIAARPALWGGRLFCSHPAFPWGKVPRRGG